jgi:uncharacterized membrane protein YGL010W
MKTLSEHLIQYSAYHRVTQNIQTHFIGIPLILLAVFSLLSFSLFEQPWLTPVVWLWLASTIFYWRLDWRFGLAMGIVLAICVALALQLAQLPTAMWLGWSVALFVMGWLLQFIGHYFEGRKPAFVDDLTGLVIGPLFVVAEVAFKLGLRPELAAQIVAATGPERPWR